MNDYDDEETGVPEGLIDMESIQEILIRAKDALRPLGITVDLDSSIPITIQQNIVATILPIRIRPSAKTRLDQDRAEKERFNKMMAEQAEAHAQEELTKAAQMLSGNKLRAFMAGEIDSLDPPCPHTRRHPDGFCLDCHEGMETK